MRTSSPFLISFARCSLPFRLRTLLHILHIDQAEGFWEDAFTGICHFRARWLLRASEVPGDVAEDEVVLTTVSDAVDATCILGLAPMGLPTADLQTEPLAPVEAEAPASDRVLRARISKGKGRKRAKNAILLLSRSFDPFAGVFGELPAEHPALVQLREREGAKTAHGDTARESDKGAKGGHQRRGPGRPRKVITPRFSVRGSPRKSSAADRAGAERKGLHGARLAVRPSRASSRERSESLSSNGSSSSSGSSIIVGENSGSSVGSISSCGSSSNSNSGFTSGDSEGYYDELDICTNASPTAGRGRRKEAVAAAGVRPEEKTGARPGAKLNANMDAKPEETPVAPVPAVQYPERPRRLAMPPGVFPGPASGHESGSDIGKPADAANASPLTGRMPLLRGGPLVRAAHQGGDLGDGELSPMAEYRHRETDVGEEHQADIPPLLTEAQRVAEKEQTSEQKMGGTLVSAAWCFWLLIDLCVFQAIRGFGRECTAVPGLSYIPIVRSV